MQRTTCRLASVPGLLALASLPVAAQSLSDATVRRIDSVFAMYDSRATPGCATSVIRDGQIVFAKGYGMSNFEHDVPITPGSIFHVASISKHFTAMSIVLLAKDGKLSLDDDIRKYLPEVPDFGQRITIRHLIHHTSGLRDQWSLLSLSGWRPDDPKTEADILWLVSRQKALNFAPGTEHLYSNTGYTLLGTIVQRVSGKSLRAFTTERIFAPLGMTSTHFHDDHSMIVPGRTSAYAPLPGRAGAPRGVENYSISIPVFDNAGATSLFTTVQDLAKWERNFLEPKVGDSAVIQQMYQRGTLANGTEIPYAFALSHGRVRGLPTIGHGGADAGYRADFVRFPEQRTAFATLCNVSTANPGALNQAVALAVLGDQMASVAPAGNSASPLPSAVPIDDVALRRLAGLYVDVKADNPVEVVYRDSTKSLHGGRAPTAPRLIHTGNKEFVAVSANGQQTRVKFSGDTLTMVTDQATLVRVSPQVLTRARLSDFAGRYRSEELDVEWTISVTSDSVITLSTRRGPDRRLSAGYADGFTSAIGVLRFSRDKAGKVNGFYLTAGRIRRIQFDRIAAPLGQDRSR
jgi:CubicO group peptidase (beta-lactamase class C family)